MLVALHTIGTAALLVMASSAPALAKDGATQRSVAAPSARADSGRLVCVRMDMANSRLRQRVCLTPAEWDRRGGLPTE